MRIAITRSDGGVSIMNLVDGLTVDDVPAELAKWEAGGFEAVSWREIGDADLPPTRALRNAWYDTGEEIAVDMEKARLLAADEVKPAPTAKDFEALEARVVALEEARWKQ